MDPIISMKAKQWHEAVLFIQSHINSYEEADSFRDLQLMVLDVSIKKGLVEEKCKQLATLANELSSKEPELSAQLNLFAGICTSYYCDQCKLRDFQQVLKKNKWADDAETHKRTEEAFEKEQEKRRRAEREKREQAQRQEEYRRRQEEETRRRKEEERKWQEQKRREEEYRRRMEEEARLRVLAATYAKKSSKRLRTRLIAFFLLLCIAGLLTYSYWYIPMTVKRDAPRTYVFADNLFIRSSKDTESEGNKKAKVPYGTELITYSCDADGWSEIEAGDNKGYVATSYTLNKEDFILLNNVWADETAREAVATTKCRLAILDFLKKKNLTSGTSGWQLYCKDAEVKPNTISYPRLSNGYNDFSDFAFILKNNQTSVRKFALYSFTETETPVLVYDEETVQTGDIKNVSFSSWRNTYNVSYTKTRTTNGVYVKPQETAVTTPPTTTNTHKAELPLTITDITFANTDYYRNTIDAYGSQLYTDIKYLSPKLTFNSNTSSKQSVVLKMRIYDPHDKLLTGTGSPSGFTNETKVEMPDNYAKSNTTTTLIGWGNKDGGVYSVEGNYRVEIWTDGQCLTSTKLYVKPRTVATKSPSTDKETLTSKIPILFYRSAFANVNTKKGKVLDNYNSRIRAKDVKAIKPRIDYTNSAGKDKSLEIAIKIISPSGTVLGDKYKDYTYYELVTFAASGGSAYLASWEDVTGKEYAPGNYAFEIWYCGSRLYRTGFTLY